MTLYWDLVCPGKGPNLISPSYVQYHWIRFFVLDNPGTNCGCPLDLQVRDACWRLQLDLAALQHSQDTTLRLPFLQVSSYLILHKTYLFFFKMKTTRVCFIQTHFELAIIFFKMPYPHTSVSFYCSPALA